MLAMIPFPEILAPSFFDTKTVGKNPYCVNFLILYMVEYLQWALLQGGVHKVSNKDCMPSLRLGLALYIIMLK
jgi:hypothetical protein